MPAKRPAGTSNLLPSKAWEPVRNPEFQTPPRPTVATVATLQVGSSTLGLNELLGNSAAQKSVKSMA